MGTAVAAQALDDESVECLSCHGLEDWEIEDPIARRTLHLSIDSAPYLSSSHGSLACTDCHAGYDFALPHRGRRLTALYECVACHQGDSRLAHFDLEGRKRALRESVHGRTADGAIDCHDCHDPHRFRPPNESDDALARVAHSNAICLGCHGSAPDRSSRFARNDPVEAHASFPSFANHLRKLPCVACHSLDPRSARHDITSAELALDDCTACHGPGMRVLDVVFGPRGTSEVGSLHADAYVVGASRSPRLELASVLIFAAVLASIALHAALRIARSRRRED